MKIRINDNTKYQDSTIFTLRYEYFIPIPASFATIPNKDVALQSFKVIYPDVDRIVDTDVVFRVSHKFNVTDTEASIKGYLEAEYAAYATKLAAITVNASDWLYGQEFDGTNWVTI